MSGGSRDEAELMRRRVAGFLEVAKHSLQASNYDIAAFNAEQAAQLCLSF